jgi:hypothetical protein
MGLFPLPWQKMGLGTLDPRVPAARIWDGPYGASMGMVQILFAMMTEFHGLW